MVKSRALILLFFFVVGGYSIVVAQDRFIVHFTDKNNSPYSVNRPEEFLSQKAISRTGREALNETDLPVNPAYIAGLETKGINVLYTTKWMNGAMVEALESDLKALNLVYISSYKKVAPNSMPTPGGRIEDKNNGENGKNELTYIQNEILDISKMHEDGYAGNGVRVAVLDAGYTNIDNNIYLKHAFDEGRIGVTYDFARKSEYVYSYSSHGANVFSIFGAYLESSYIGGGYGANFDLFITEYPPTEFPIEEYNWLLAAEKADSIGVDIITTSVGYFDFEPPLEGYNYTFSDLDGKTAIITRAAEIAFSKGILVIASAGNEGNKTWEKITFPADGENVLAVGAVENSNLELITDFSSVGPTFDNRIKPDVLAVGGATTYINTASVISTGNGTSYAAPLITGLAAGLWEKYPELSNVELRDIIVQSGNRVTNPDTIYGHGIPNYVRASRIYEGVLTGTIDDEKEGIVVYPNPVAGDLVYIRSNGLNQKSLLEVINIHGQMVISTSINQYLEAEIDISNLKKGLYWIRASNDRQLFNEPFVIE